MTLRPIMGELEGTSGGSNWAVLVGPAVATLEGGFLVLSMARPVILVTRDSRRCVCDDPLRLTRMTEHSAQEGSNGRRSHQDGKMRASCRPGRH